MHAPCGIVLGIEQEFTGIQKFLAISLAVLIFFTGPVITYLVALGYLIYGLALGSSIICSKINAFTENQIFLTTALSILIIPLFICLAAVLATLCIPLLAIALLLAYVLFIVMFGSILFQWCLKSKKATAPAKTSYATEKASLLESFLTCEYNEDLLRET